MRFTQAIALATLLLAAAPARAGWERAQFVDSSGQPATPPALMLKAVGVGAGGKVWAVGGAAGASFIVTSTDGFVTAQQDTSCASINRTLNTVWVAPDGSYVHAFGLTNAHAEWDGTGWGCANFTTPSGIGSPGSMVNVFSAAFSDAATGYLGGATPAAPMTSVLIQYSAGTLTNASYLNNFSVSTMARSSASGALLFSTQSMLYRHPDPFGSPIVNLAPGVINSLFLLGDSGLVSAGQAVSLRKINAAARSASAPSGTLPDFEPILGVTLAPQNFALAVGQASGSTVAGAIAQSDDGGDNWRRIDLSGINPVVKVLRAVACWDENHCVAVGANDLGGGSYSPEFLRYVNNAPTATVTVNGQPLPATGLYDDADVTLQATASEPDGDPFTLTWIGPTSVDGSHAATVTFTPAVSCSPQNLPHVLELTDGRLTTTLDVPIVISHKLKPAANVGLTPAPSSGNTYEWQVGPTYTLTASATKDCGRPVAFQFDQVGIPPPVSISGTGGSVATYRIDSGCGGTGSITLTVKDSDASFPDITRTYDVHVPEVVEAPQVSLSPAGPTIDVPFGTALTTVTANVTAYCGGTDPSLFKYEWSCDPTATGPSIQFHHDTDPCASTIDCTLKVTPPAPGLVATKSFTVNLQAASASLAITPSGTVPVAPGESITVKATANHFCKPTFSWSCPGLPNPPGAVDQWQLTNPQPNCSGGGTYTCTLTVTGEGQTESESVTFVFGQSSRETSVGVAYSPDVRVLQAEGDSVQATVQASNACAAAFDYSWLCSGVQAPQGSAATTIDFVHPGNCADLTASCEVTATPKSATGLPGKGTVEVTFKGVAEPPTGLTLNARIDGKVVVADAQVIGGTCQDSLRYLWKVWVSPNEAEPDWDAAASRSEYQKTVAFCGQRTVNVKVKLAGHDLEQLIELPAEGTLGIPVIASAGDALHQELKCDGAYEFVVTPNVINDCAATRHWRQISGPSLPFRVENGALTIAPDPTQLASVWGAESTFELTVSNAEGTSEPKTVGVRFEAPEFVTLQHDSDRRSATAGEPVFFTITASTGSALNSQPCQARLEGVMDLLVDLEGLELISGSCKVNGVRVEDPAAKEETDLKDPSNPRKVRWLLFPGLATPAKGGAPTTVTYYARRQTSASGVVVSRAEARLHGTDVKISDSSEAGGRPPVKGSTVPLSCNCSEAGSGPAAWAAAGALLAAVARRRRRNLPC